MFTLTDLIIGAMIGGLIYALTSTDLDEVGGQAINPAPVAPVDTNAILPSIQMSRRSSSIAKKQSDIPKGIEPVVVPTPAVVVPRTKLDFEVDPSKRLDDPQIITSQL